MKRREAVRIERRAAEIAAGVISGIYLQDDTLLGAGMKGSELGGWMRYADNAERGTYPKSADWQAGWLAAAIYSHEVWNQPSGHRL
jgi:hypothetical protein